MITLDSNSNIPLYVQIYEQLKNEIITGILPKDSKLPSTRYLAATLSVGRNTIENAYLQLSSEGYVSSKAGSGFFVRDIHYIINSISKKENNIISNKLKTTKENSIKPCKYNFEYGCLNSEKFPLGVLKKTVNKIMTSLTADDMVTYCDGKGEIELRIVLSDYLRRYRGVFCSDDQIIICSGLEYALSLLCQLLRKYSNQVLLEDPGYFGARTIFKNNGFKVIPISIKEDGLNLDELRNSSSKIVYVTPSHQFPTGAVMPIQKRLLLLEWAAQNDGIIIEDDYDGELRYNSRPIPSINNITKSNNVVYIGTFSKILSPSMRINYVVLPEKLVKLYNENFKMYRCPVSLIQQRIIQQFIYSGYWINHLRKISVANKKKHDLLVHTIQQFMAKKVIIHGKNAGLHILLESIQGLTEIEMIKKAKKYGVRVYPVSIFWINKNHYSNNMVLLGFGNISESDIIEGIRRLSQAWE